MAAHAKWDALLEESEGALTRNRFSFDLHRQSAIALDALGHGAARRVLVREVRSLLERLPELVNLSFANGRPFADDATRRFFADEGGAATARDTTTGDRDSKRAELRASFESTLREGSLADALEVADALVRDAREGRDRFQERLSIARSLAAQGRPELARIFHEALDEDARTRALETWDPELCLEHLAGFVEVERALAPSGAKSPRVAELVARIARISPSAVARWVR